MFLILKSPKFMILITMVLDFFCNFKFRNQMVSYNKQNFLWNKIITSATVLDWLLLYVRDFTYIENLLYLAEYF